MILQDHAGEWWLASSQGLCRYPRLDSPSQLAQTAPKAVYTTRDGLPSDVVVRLYEDRGGNIWVGTETGNFAYWSRSEQRFIGIAADGVPNYASAFGEDNGGHVWIGDELGQLWRVQDGQASRVAGPARRGWIQRFSAGPRRTPLGGHSQPGTAALRPAGGAQPPIPAIRLLRRAFQPPRAQPRRGPQRLHLHRNRRRSRPAGSGSGAHPALYFRRWHRSGAGVCGVSRPHRRHLVRHQSRAHAPRPAERPRQRPAAGVDHRSVDCRTHWRRFRRRANRVSAGRGAAGAGANSV